MTSKRKPACNCPPGSPFHWLHEQRDSFAIAEKSMRTNKSGASSAQTAAETIRKAEAQGKNPGTIAGISRDREAELKRLRDFTVYSRARPDKAKP